MRKESGGGKRKKNRESLAVLLAAILTGAVCGVVLAGQKGLGNLSGGQQIFFFVLFLLALYAAVLIQIVIHEAGHLIFGLLSGYQFCSFRILNLMWIRSEGRIRLKRLSIAGTGGQCLMAPPDLQNGEMPVLLYNFGGSILNACSAVAFFGLSFLFRAGSSARVFMLLLSIVGFGFALMNGIPMRSGTVDNDGRNAIALRKNPEAVRAFWIQMKVAQKISEGTRLKDMPPEWFVLPSDAAMENGIIAGVGVLACNRLMDEHRFEEADRAMAHLLAFAKGTAGLYRGLMQEERIFIELIGPCRPEVLDRMMDREQEKLMKAMKRYPSVLRTEYARSLLRERDERKAEKILMLFERYAESYPYPCEIQSEKELIKIVLERVESNQDRG